MVAIEPHWRHQNTRRGRQVQPYCNCRQDASPHFVARRSVPRVCRHTKFTKVLSSGVMRQPVKRQAVKRCVGYLTTIATMELVACLIVVPVDAARHLPVPVPRPRPATLGAQSPPSPATQIPDLKQPGQTDDAAQDAEACLGRLRTADIKFDIPAMPVAAKTSCAIEVPVRLKSIKTRARTVTKVRLPEEPVVSCQFAERLTAWLGNLVAPLIAGRMSADLRAVHTGPGYECRNRNGAAVGKLSAHAIGQAIDISVFELSNGKSIAIKPNGDETTQNVVDSVRTAACGWFTTVLGPGADAAHTDHLHVDIAMHGTSDRYRICQ
jgi:hypothetical protein